MEEDGVYFGISTGGLEGIAVTPTGSRDQSPEVPARAEVAMADPEAIIVHFQARKVARRNFTRARNDFMRLLDGGANEEVEAARNNFLARYEVLGDANLEYVASKREVEDNPADDLYIDEAGIVAHEVAQRWKVWIDAKKAERRTAQENKVRA